MDAEPQKAFPTVDRHLHPESVHPHTPFQIPETPSLSLSDLLDPDTHFPIHETFWKYVLLRDAVALSSTCRKLRAAFWKQWNVDKRLKRFVQDPCRLRSRLGQSDALISGSFALQFFARKTWLDSDLDVFVETGPGVMTFDKYLREEESYSLDSIKKNEYNHEFRLVEGRTYYRPTFLDPTRAKVQIIVSQSMPIEEILTEFYMTAVVNFISWNQAYSVFAKETLIDQDTYMLTREEPHHKALLEKYDRRGWTLKHHNLPKTSPAKCRFQWLRRLGDKHTWIIPLSTVGVSKPKQPDTILEYSTFDIRPWPYESERARFILSVSAFQHIALDYRYIHNGWMFSMADRLHGKAMRELLALSPEDCASWYGEEERRERTPVSQHYFCASDPIRNFKKPKSWRSYDDYIPQLYHQWSQSTRPEELLQGAWYD